jgi:hypothetical protein
MPYPPECKMPDLIHLQPLTNRLLVQLLIGEPGIPTKVSQYRINFVRLIDKSLFEYNNARNTILSQIAEAKRPSSEMQRTGRHISFYGFTNHIENCINALCRTTKLLHRIKTHPGAPGIPRGLRKDFEKGGRSIDDLRNAVEHIDDIIRKDELDAGKPLVLALTEDSEGITIADYNLKFTDLAFLLSNIHEIGEYVLTIKKPC